MKKIKKSKSYLSMENLDIEEETEEIDVSADEAINKNTEVKQTNDVKDEMPKLSSENVVLHPIYILG